MRVLRNAIVILGVVAVALTVRPSFAQSRTEEIADAKAEMEQAKQYLQALARQRQGLTEELSVDEKEWVGAALLDWYRTSRKFNSLREQRDNGDISEEDAIRQLEEFSRVETGELSLEGAFVKAGEKIRKGRLQMYDDLDRRQDLVMQRFRDAWERVRALENRPRPDELKAAERVQGGPLTLKAVPSSVDLEVGEPGIVTLVVSGSKPPYTLRVVSLSGDDTRVLRLDSQDFVDLPFSFSTPGVRTVDISLEDESIPRQRARVTVTFRVTEPEEDEGETEEEPPQKPPPERDAGDEEKEDDQTSKGDEDKDPAEEEKEEGEDEDGYKPWELEPGSYEALLYPTFLHGDRQKKDLSSTAFPERLIITFNGDGTIAGRCSNVLSRDELFNPAPPDNQFTGWRTSYTLKGQVDWETGNLKLSIPDGARFTDMLWPRFGTEDGPIFNVRGHIDVKYEASFNGWQISDPRHSKSFQDTLDKHPQAKQGFADRLGVTRNDSGELSFAKRGWRGIEVAKLTRHIWKRPIETVDWTSDFQESYEKQQWSFDLIILRKVETRTTGVTEEEDDAEEPEGELVGFGIWPESPLRVKAGATFQVEAVGVYAENIFDVKQLHDDRSQWDAHSGLEELEKPGQYRPLGPGPYQVRVRRQRNDGSWMSDTVTIHVTP